MFVLAAAFWLHSFSNRIQEQTETLQKLVKSSDETEAKQRPAHALLAKSDGGSSDTFASLYDRVTRERDDFQRDLDRLHTSTNALTDRADPRRDQ